MPRSVRARSKARNALILNLLATPGLGTWMVGKRVTGALQAGLAGAGLIFVLIWFVSWSMALLHGGRVAHRRRHAGDARSGVYLATLVSHFGAALQGLLHSFPDAVDVNVEFSKNISDNAAVLAEQG